MNNFLRSQDKILKQLAKFCDFRSISTVDLIICVLYILNFICSLGNLAVGNWSLYL